MGIFNRMLKGLRSASDTAIEVGSKATRLPGEAIDAAKNWSMTAAGRIDAAARLTNPELEQVRSLLSGPRQQLDPELHEARVSRLKQARLDAASLSLPPLHWCERCTRVLCRPADLKPDMLGHRPEHRALEFLFAGGDGFCVDCAITRSVSIPCIATGAPFVPVIDPTNAAFGHSVMSPGASESLADGHVLLEDRTLRPATVDEQEAEAAVAAVTAAFEASPYEPPPHLIVTRSDNPHWIFGHYANALAQTGQLHEFLAGLDSEGLLHVRIGHTYFIASPTRGGITVQGCVDNPEEPASVTDAALDMANGFLTNAAASFGGDSENAGLKEGATRAAALVLGKKMVATLTLPATLVIAAASGVAGALNRARSRQKTIHQITSDVTKRLDGICKTLQEIASNQQFMTSAPPILDSVPRAPQRLEPLDWPSHVDVGRARSALSKPH